MKMKTTFRACAESFEEDEVAFREKWK